MTPNPNSPRFISNEIPSSASSEMKKFADYLTGLRRSTADGRWNGITSDNFSLEYNSYDNSVQLRFTYNDTNDHLHIVTARLVTGTYYGSTRFAKCEWLYMFEGGTFNRNVCTIRSFAESLMLKLWDAGVDVELCNCDRGLKYTSDIDSVLSIFDKTINALVNNIKPMDWFYIDEPIWKLRKSYFFLTEILSKIQVEADKGRWPEVSSKNFRLLRDNNQAYLVISYVDNGIYDMTFKVGLEIGGFDPETTGDWFECIYEFRTTTSDNEVKEYFINEQKEFYKVASSILDAVSYKMLFFHGDDKNSFSIVVEKEYTLQKFCLMLDILLPLKNKYEASHQLITKNILMQKEAMEKLLDTKMEIVESNEPEFPFTHGSFISFEDEQEMICYDDCPF